MDRAAGVRAAEVVEFWHGSNSAKASALARAGGLWHTGFSGGDRRQTISEDRDDHIQ